MHAIDYSHGKANNLMVSDYKENVNQLFEFWRFLRIQEDLLLTTADVGDLILCISQKKYSLKNRCNAIEEICLVVKLDEEEDGITATKTVGKARKCLYVIRVGSSRQGVILQNWN